MLVHCSSIHQDGYQNSGQKNNTKFSMNSSDKYNKIKIMIQLFDRCRGFLFFVLNFINQKSPHFHYKDLCLLV